MSPTATTFSCPVCGNINPAFTDTCLKCNFDLKDIKAALVKAGVLEVVPLPGSVPAVQKEKKKFALPMLPWKDNSEDLGKLLESDMLFFPAKSDERENLTAAFISEVESHQIPGIEISFGSLIVEKQTRDCVYAQLYLEPEGGKVMGLVEKKDKHRARSTIAVRIDAAGKDLVIEWRNYVRTAVSGAGVISTVAVAYVTAGVSLLSKVGRDMRNLSLRGFENPDNTVFAVSILTALHDAVEAVGLNFDLAKKPISQKPEKKRII